VGEGTRRGHEVDAFRDFRAIGVRIRSTDLAQWEMARIAATKSTPSGIFARSVSAFADTDLAQWEKVE